MELAIAGSATPQALALARSVALQLTASAAERAERERFAARTRKRAERERSRAGHADNGVTPGEALGPPRGSHAECHAEIPVTSTVTSPVTSGVTSPSRARSEDQISLSSQDLTEEIPEERENARGREVTLGHADNGVTAAAALVARETVRERLERDHPGIESVAVYQRISEQLKAITGRAWDVQGNLAAFGFIAAQPAAEWDLALAKIAGDPWCRENAGKVSPQHLRRQWPSYAEPPKQTLVPPTPASRAERVRDLQAQLRAARQQHRLARRDNDRRTAGVAVATLERELVSLGVLETPDDEAAA